MNDNLNTNIDTKRYEIITSNYNLYKKTDIKGDTYYTVTVRDGDKNPDGSDIVYLCFKVKRENPNYPGKGFISLEKLHNRGFELPCVELKLLVFEYISNTTGKEVRRIGNAEWTE